MFKMENFNQFHYQLKTYQIGVEIGVLSTEVVNGCSAPVDHVLGLLLDKTNSFQNISDVVNSPLLNAQGFGSLKTVEVNLLYILKHTFLCLISISSYD